MIVNEIYKLVKSFCKKWNIYDEDIVQDLVIDVYYKLDKYKKDKSKFSTFVYMVCKTSYLMKQRKKKLITVSLDLPVDDEIYMYDMAEDDSENALDEILKKDNIVYYIYNNICSPQLKDYLNGMKQKDIAKKYNIPCSTLNQRLSKEIKMLKETYGK